MRLVLVALQAAFLAMGYFMLAATAAPFTAEGLVGTPSRMAGAVFVVSRMPLDGPLLLGIARLLLFIPAASLLLAFLAGFPFLRPLRWLGVAVCLFGAAYLAHRFPAVASFKAVPWPLMVFLLLYSGSAVCFALLPQKPDAAFSRYCAASAQVAFWAGTMGLLWYGAMRQNVPARGLAMVGACAVSYSLAFYCLLQASLGRGTKIGPARLLHLLLPAALAGAAVCFTPPMAMPLIGGLVVWLASAVP